MLTFISAFSLVPVLRIEVDLEKGQYSNANMKYARRRREKAAMSARDNDFKFWDTQLTKV